MGEQRTIRTFPSDDGRFHAFAQECRAAVGDDPAQLQAVLRTRYPAAVVRIQDALARRGADETWYAFRFGAIVTGPDARSITDWAADDVAHAVLDDERRLLELDERFAAILEAPLTALCGRRLDEFANPDDPTILDDLAGLWQEFLRAGVAESTIRYDHGDGRPRELAYRLVRDVDGPGRHRLLVRQV